MGYYRHDDNKPLVFADYLLLTFGGIIGLFNLMGWVFLAYYYFSLWTVLPLCLSAGAIVLVLMGL